jgi:hypothetical protein
MKKLMTTIAFVSPIAAPVFATPGQAAMVGLLTAIALIGIATIMSFGVNSSNPTQQPSISRSTAVAAGPSS